MTCNVAPKVRVEFSPVQGRVIRLPGIDLTPDAALDLALSLLRETMTDLQREVLSNALYSWHSQCEDYNKVPDPELDGPGPAEDTGDGSSWDDQLNVVEGLEVALGLREAP